MSEIKDIFLNYRPDLLKYQFDLQAADGKWYCFVVEPALLEKIGVACGQMLQDKYVCEQEKNNNKITGE